MDPEIQSQDLNPGTLLLDPATLLFSSKGHPPAPMPSPVARPFWKDLHF